MNDKRKAFNNIVAVIYLARYSFWNEYEIAPNKIIMSKDVFDFITSYSRDLSLYLDDEKNSFMGMDVEVVLDKKGFIEVGCFAHNPITVNVDYVSEGGE